MAKDFDLFADFMGKVMRAEDNVYKAVEEAVERGGEVMREKIDTTGTSRGLWRSNWDAWPHAHKGRRESRNRVAKGRMRRAVRNYYNRSRRKATGKFGWTRPSERRPYFLFQEHGGKHNKVKGLTVEGMYALTDARAEAEQHLRVEGRRKFYDSF